MQFEGYIFEKINEFLHLSLHVSFSYQYFADYFFLLIFLEIDYDYLQVRCNHFVSATGLRLAFQNKILISKQNTSSKTHLSRQEFMRILQEVFTSRKHLKYLRSFVILENGKNSCRINWSRIPCFD